MDYAGFAKDLLWASSSDQQEELLDALSIDGEEWRHWADSADVAVDVEGKKLVMNRVSERTWDRLHPNVRLFLATAMLHLEAHGHAPQVDYAPVSIEVVKALEVELGEVLDGFRKTVNGRVFSYDEAEISDLGLNDFLRGKKPPTLGTIAYLLRQPKPSASELRLALHAYLAGLPNGAFLTGNAFANKGLQKVINRYRNGGAHDSPISEKICLECIEVIIGKVNSPGYLPQVVEWKG